MPHIIVEYTDNLKQDGDIKGLLKKINEAVIAEGDAFPIGGIRSRAVELTDYVVADGAEEEDAFVHVTLKIGKGRSEVVRKAVCDQIFQVIEQHFENIYANRYLALSMELYEFPYPTYKKNNIHKRYK
ncbi:5-carboxymethyl-2-hydroxymuconate Delta-isomerase [Ornithinibacillus halotolerans]|uniref:5-carboxymethyl-2-hydroxymuconate isomerase n=1 Tax=Ornithinibacillus halotolerans TaxID=1274357 RepID=A0A916RR97_9BACI|nr:5-carboxymethyl-2-hydroxymuconate Delta-isomerase [Ornithinibacillus halotolerans]GGA66386.1 5-carboxymethyl-2-hydroxymuconate isomerase [Ornithinibacillus halotolerans]